MRHSRSEEADIVTEQRQDIVAADSTTTPVGKETLECVVDCTEDIEWEVRINNTLIKGNKCITTGDRLDLVVHMQLYTDEMWKEKQQSEEIEEVRR